MNCYTVYDIIKSTSKALVFIYKFDFNLDCESFNFGDISDLKYIQIVYNIVYDITVSSILEIIIIALSTFCTFIV